MKKTWKLGSVKGQAAEVMRSSASLAEAARGLGVDRQTVHRWVKAGKIPAPGGRQPPLRSDHNGSAAAELAVPVDWAASVRASYALTPTEDTLVGLAEAALGVARDAACRVTERLSAMQQFQRLVRQLHLEDPQHGDMEDLHAWRRKVG